MKGDGTTTAGSASRRKPQQKKAKTTKTSVSTASTTTSNIDSNENESQPQATETSKASEIVESVPTTENVQETKEADATSVEPAEVKVKSDENVESNEEKDTDQGEGADEEEEDEEEEEDKDYVNPRGVRFIQDGPNGQNAANTPYGLPCVRELLRFLISLINTKNSDLMISMGLNLITIGLESGIDYISSYQSLLAYVKDDLLKNLYNLLSTERMAHYASVLRVSFFLFESLRSHLKLQMEHFLNKLMDICLILSPDSANPAGSSSHHHHSQSNKLITQEQKEMTIDYFLQMLRIPGFAVEIYLNYDCSLNCSNLFENLTKLLSKVVTVGNKLKIPTILFFKLKHIHFWEVMSMIIKMYLMSCSF